MADLILVGSSGLAREVISVLRLDRRQRLLGIVDDSEANWGGSVDGVPILGGLDRAVAHPTARLLLCVGRGTARVRLAARLARMGIGDGRFARVVHPSVDVPRTVHLGAGSILLAGTVLTADIVVGRHVVAMPNVVLTHGDRVESFATLCSGTVLGGGVRIGEEAYLGMNSSVRERVRVGRGGVLGMGAALVHDLPAGETWVGVPAMPLRAGTGPRSVARTVAR